MKSLAMSLGRRPSRRVFMVSGGAAVLGLWVAGCGGGGDGDADDAAPGEGPGGAEAPSVTSLTAADFDDVGACQLVAEQTEGPFYLDAELVRQDITEGVEGYPLRLGLRVVDESCRPLPNAVVDVWHADADGDYSAFTDGGSGDDAAAGTTFLRGSQVANTEGIVEFATVYPGWYPGRTVHIHAKVHVDDRTTVTTQLYFPDELSDAVFATGRYADHGAQDTTNTEDAIAGDPMADGTLLTTAPAGDGTLALLVMGVTARS